MNRRELIALLAAAPFGLRAAIAAAARAPRALVTCDDEARLAVVDLGAFRVERHVDTLPDPRSVELVGTRAVVCHWNVGAVSVVDGEHVHHVLHGFDQPRYTAAHPDGVHAFVTDSGHASLVAVDVLRGRAVGRVKLSGWPRHLSIAPDGKTLWVGLGSSSLRVAVVDVSDPVRPRHVGTVTPPFPAHDVGFAPGGQVWVTSGGARETSIHAPSGAVVARLAADAAPQHVTFGDGRAYVTSGGSGTLTVHGPDGRALRATPIPTGSYNVQHGPGRVITPSLEHGTLTVLDRRGALLARVQVAAGCHDACFLAV